MDKRKDFLPFALPSIEDDEKKSVLEVLESGWITTGPKVRDFERRFARFTGSSHAIAVNSGTAGLHLALEAVGVGAGDKVITTPYTFTATAEVVRYLGADPVFVDIDPKTCNIDPEKVSIALERHSDVKAILPVHFAGQACDMDPILSLAEKYGLGIVEDAAHALPSAYKGRMVGRLGDITVYSFYATKPLATGEGGMVVTDDPSYAERIGIMRLHGINQDVFDRYRVSKPSWYYEVVAPGFKYNMTDIVAAIGIQQLRKAESFRSRRERIAKRYTAGLRDLPLELPAMLRSDDVHAWHIYLIRLHLEQLTISRDRFIELLYEEGIGSSVHFIPLHLHPYWRDRYQFAPGDFPVSLDVYRRAVSLPIYPAMTDDDVERVIVSVRRILLKSQKT